LTIAELKGVGGLVNRALMLLDFVEGRTAAGDALVLLNPQGENTRVILL